MPRRCTAAPAATPQLGEMRATNAPAELLAEDVHDDGTDASSIRRSLADAEAFAPVFDRHARAIHRYLSRRVGTDIADDLTGETFLVAFDRREKYDTTYADALPWLYGIATKLLGRHRRRESGYWRAWARTGTDPVQECHADAVSRQVTAQNAAREIAGSLAALPAAQRDVLLLVAWQELEYEEVARALGIPIGTVRSRLHRARTRLKKAVGPTDLTVDTEE